jgi:beta-galactosidase/beta-glucuronidase
LTACLALYSTSWLASASEPPRTHLVTVDGTHRLIRDGQPYFVKGVGGHTHLAELAAAGGNSIRTWGTDHLDELLDQAHRHGLTVCVGLWLGHERHGFDYQDLSSVVDQLDTCRKAVHRYKDHPAVLMWGIGNEMEGDGSNPAIWYAVDHIAR